MANSVTILIKAKDEASSEIDRVKGKLNAVSSSDGFKSVMKGVGLGAGISAWGLVQGAIGNVVGSVGDLIKGGMEEQASQARLVAALKASVQGWNGNLKFINQNIDAGMKMGFTDDAMRDSMARLLPITKSVGEAQVVQAAAMDLARFKSIDLVTASLAIGKAMEGNKKMLKELGIDVKDAADAQQTLAAVQTAVSGQAAAYMDTLAGKMEAADARIKAMKDDMGSWLATQGDNLFKGLDVLNFDAKAHGFNDNAGLGPFQDWGAQVKDYNLWLGQLEQTQKDVAATTALQARKDADLSAAMDTAKASAAGLDPSIRDLDTSTSMAARAAMAAADKFDTLKTHYDDLQARLTATNDLKELPLRIAVAKDDIVKAQDELNKARTSSDKHAAALRLQQAKDELASLRLELTSKSEQAAMEAAMAKLGAAGALGFSSAFGALTVEVVRGIHQSGAGKGRALGGPVQAGEVYRVGETRPEYLIPRQDGYISPNAPAPSSGGAVSIVGVSESQLADMIDRQLYFRLRRAVPTSGRV